MLRQNSKIVRMRGAKNPRPASGIVRNRKSPLKQVPTMAQMFKNNRDSNMNLYDLDNIQDLDDQNNSPLIQRLMEKGIYDRDGSKEEL